MSKSRLDSLLAERGLFESRSRAAAAVMAGKVRLGGEGRRAQKPGQMVAGDVAVAGGGGDDHVSRGGAEIADAIDAVGPSRRRPWWLRGRAPARRFTRWPLPRGGRP